MKAMSHDFIDRHADEPATPAHLRSLARAGDASAVRLRAASVEDLFRPEHARIDDRRRAALRTLIRTIVGSIGGELVEGAAARLASQGAGSAAMLDAVEARRVLPLVETLLAADAETAADLIERVTLDLIGDALPEGLVEEGVGRPAALSNDALMAAESRRRAPPDQPPYTLDLAAEGQARFVWWTAAAIAQVAAADDAVLSEALVHAARAILAAHDEGERLEAIARRIALRTDLHGEALGAAIDLCLKERRIVLLVALLAQAAGVDYAEMRMIVVTPDDDRLWLVLRMIDLPDACLARLGYALSEADPRRDSDRFADRFAEIRAIDADAARAALAPLRLPAPMRAAIEALA
jgi:hypothetical protein